MNNIITTLSLLMVSFVLTNAYSGDVKEVGKGDLPAPAGGSPGDCLKIDGTGSFLEYVSCLSGVTLESLDDVTAPSPLIGQSLRYTGTTWENSYNKEVITHLSNADFVGGVYTLSACFGTIEVDTSGAASALTLKVPDSASGNDGQTCRVYLSDATQTLNITTVGGTQLIGGKVTQTIEDVDKGVLLLSDFTDTRYLLPQSNRFDTTSTVQFDTHTDGVTNINTLEDYIDYTGSSTLISGGAITDNGDGTVNVAQSEWVLRDGGNDNDTLRPLSVPAISNLSLTDGVITNIIVDYNSGSPQYTTSPQATPLTGNSRVPIYTIYRNGNFLDILSFDKVANNFANEYTSIEARTNWLEVIPGGLTPSINSLNADRFDATAGTLRTAINAYDIPTFSGDTDTFKLVYRDGSGGWTITDATSIPTQYDDGDGTPASLGPSYGLFWYIPSASGDMTYILMGKAAYANIGNARAVQTPVLPLPPFAQAFGTGKIRSRFIFENGEIQEIATFVDEPLQSSAISDHNTLSSLQGGTVGEYFHLSSDQHTIATQPASESVAGYVNTSTQSFAGEKRFESSVIINNSASISATRIEGSSDSNLLYVDSADNRIGIRTDVPEHELHIKNPITASAKIEGGTGAARLYMNGSIGNFYMFSSDVADEVGFYSINYAATRMRIRANGEILLPAVYSNTTSAAANVYIDAAGSLYRSTSVEEVKNILGSIGGELTYQLEPIKYTSKLPNDDGTHEYFGFGARATEAVSPSFAVYDGNGEVVNYDTRAILASAVATIKEQKVILDAICEAHPEITECL